jgi:hypothetical protein
MAYPKTVFIGDVSGPPGSQDAVETWCQETAKALAGESGVERIGRYRKLNDIRTLVVAELEGDQIPEALKEAFTATPAPFQASSVVARQRAERMRDDVEGDPRDCPLFYTVSFPVPDDREQVLAEWYDGEHSAMLQECPYWLMTRRFHIETGGAQWGNHLALHYLSDIRALRSPERATARRTPWRDRVAAEPWFRGKYNVCIQEV